REYGLMKATNSSTPFPKRSGSFDPARLKAKLNQEKEFRQKVESEASNSPGFSKETSSIKFPQTLIFSKDPASVKGQSFEMRRKIFDRAEFTICKGRKMSDLFHQSNPRRQNINWVDQRRESLTRLDRSLKDIQDYCDEQRIQMIQGFH
ncbi:hypothetical protein KR018_000011, partial [Drosophila ironensis]